MKNILFLFISLVALGCSVNAAEMGAEQSRAINTYLTGIASNLNETLPMRVDNALVLTNSYAEGTTFVYSYMVDMPALRATSIEILGAAPTDAEVAKGLKGATLAFDCSDIDDNPFFLTGAKIKRVYYDMKMNLLFSAINEKSDCETLVK